MKADQLQLSPYGEPDNFPHIVTSHWGYVVGRVGRQK
jgi:hypothetical protein